MRSIVSALLVTTALALSQGPTVAQEFEPVEWWSPDPFSGAYIGATAGWVHADTDQTLLPPAPGLPSTKFRGSDDDGPAVGLHAGYNWQFGALVTGFETDISWMDLDPSSTGLGSTRTTSFNYFGTVRGRLGWAFENVLFYGTGGFAYAGLDHKFSETTFGTSFSNDEVATGWTAGGGTEWAIDPWTFLRIEALYVDLDDTTITYDFSNSGCDAQFEFCTARIRWENEFYVVRLGLSVKFP